MILVCGTAVSQVLLALVAPLLTRIYTVQQFGALQVFMTVLGFGLAVVAARYEWAILLPAEEGDAANVAVLALVIVGATVLLFGGCIALCVGLNILPASIAPLRPYWWLIPLSLTGAGLSLVLNYWAIRCAAYARIAIAKTSQTAVQVFVQIIGGSWLHLGLGGLLWGDAVGRLAGCVPLAWHSLRRGPYEISRARMWGLAKRYKSFPLISSSSALINTAGFGLPVLMIAQGYDAKVLGWFSLVDRLMSVPCALVGQAASQVYQQEAAERLRCDVPGLRDLFHRRAWQIAALGTVPFIALAVFAPWLFATVFGPDWQEAGRYAQLLVPMNLVSFVIWPLMPTLNLLERQSWQLSWDVGRLVATVATLGLIQRYGGSASIAVAGYGSAMMLAYAAHGVLSYVAIIRRIREFELSKMVS